MAEVHFRPVQQDHGPARMFCDRRRSVTNGIHSHQCTEDAMKVTCQRCLRLLAEIGAAAVLLAYPTRGEEVTNG